MNEHTFGPHHPDWTNEHQEASEPTEREIRLLEQIDSIAEKLDTVQLERDDIRKFHDSAMLALYEMLGIDSSDGEVRFKWASLEVASLVGERDMLKSALTLANEVCAEKQEIIEKFLASEAELVSRCAKADSDLKKLEEMASKSRTGVTLERVYYAEEGRVIDNGFRVISYHNPGPVKPTVAEAIRSAKVEEDK